MTRPSLTWHDQAACRNAPEAFEGPGPKADARALCQVCPVKAACLASAMIEEGPDDEQCRWGVRGGLTPGQRAELSRIIRAVPTQRRPTEDPEDPEDDQ